MLYFFSFSASRLSFFSSMPFHDNSNTDTRSSEMVTSCRSALDELNLWLDTADMQSKKYRIVSDSCLEKLAEAAEALQKTLVCL